MHLAPLSTSIQLDLPTTICPLRGNVNLRCLSGQRVAASTNRTLMVAATKASLSLAGTIRTELHAVTSPYPTSVVKSAGRQSPRHPVSPTTRTAYETTRQNQFPAHPTRLQVLCPVPCRCRWAWVSAVGPRIRWIGPAKLLCAKNANPTPSSKPSN